MRKPKDHRNGQFSGVECSSLNPAPSFLLLFCGKKVEKYKNIVMYFSHPPLTESDTRQSRQALSSLCAFAKALAQAKGRKKTIELGCKCKAKLI
jgi:hypothetical protein